MTLSKRIAIAASAAVVALALAATVYVTGFAARGGQTSALDIGGPFVLSSSKGGEVDSKTLAGHPYAVFFGYTHCPEVCPTSLYEMSSSLDKLGSAAKDFRVFFITVDPERDTVPVLKDYIANFDPRIEALVPDGSKLQQLASDFRVYYAKTPGTGGTYTMDHTASIFLFDAAGRFAGTISYGEAPAMREAKLKRLLGS